MNTLYIKDGEIKARNQIIITGVTMAEQEEGGELVEMPFTTYCPTHELLVDNGWVIYTQPEPTLDEIKQDKINQIDMYDRSENVNSFLLNGVSVWLSKADRVGLMNSINIEKAAGREISTLWFNNIMIQVGCEQAIQMLSALEMYALDCYNVTAQHKFNVHNLESKEEIEQYDYTLDYPQKLEINI